MTLVSLKVQTLAGACVEGEGQSWLGQGPGQRLPGAGVAIELVHNRKHSRRVGRQQQRLTLEGISHRKMATSHPMTQSMCRSSV